MRELFLVSPADDPATMLRETDSMLFDKDYLFWIYFATGHSRAFLGRHARIGKRHQPDREWDQTGFTVGLRPKQPNQTWRVYSPFGVGSGETVLWNFLVGLTVGGKDPNRKQSDSTERRYLSVTDTKPHVTAEEWGANEHIQLIPIRENTQQQLELFAQDSLCVHAIPDV